MSNYPRVKLGKTEICNMTFFPFGIAIVWKDTPIWRKKDTDSEDTMVVSWIYIL